MELVHVEIIQKPENMVKNVNLLSDECNRYLEKIKVSPGTILKQFDNELLDKCVEYIIFSDCTSINTIEPGKVNLIYYVYTLDKFGAQLETADHNDEEIQIAIHWALPTFDFFNLWENLIYDTDIKERLLNYASTTVLFADMDVDSNIICCNKVILLHGPPGTGKTSLCKALAQKLSIRMQNRFKRSQLVEVNSHSLFSKWFSESGKLVTKMFSKIVELVEDPDTLVFVLIDEVESLAHARQQCMSGTEPSDSLRVVNAVLTQIDQLKRYPNVLLLTTSNLTEAIDLAFVDRADIKQYIGLPGEGAIYHIYCSCLLELIRAKVIFPNGPLLPYHSLIEDLSSDVCENSRKLLEISKLSIGFSGRTLRKIPFLAHALHLQKNSVSLEIYLQAMGKAVLHQKTSEQSMTMP